MSVNIANEQFIADALKNTVTFKDVAIVAQIYTNDKSVKILDHSIDDYSKEKLGFLASHRILTIKFQRSNSNETESTSFFIKSIPYDFQVQVDILIDGGQFYKESEFFRRVIPELMKDINCEKWYPECYLVKKDTIILEDLKIQGYKLIDTVDNMVALKSVLVSLARLHGSSLLLEGRLNCNSENRINIKDHYSDIFQETLFKTSGAMTEILLSFFHASCNLSESLGYNPDELRKSFNRVLDMLKDSKNHCNVICHGDLWRNNLMFNDNYKCVLVDFQGARYAPLVTDLLQFLHMNSTRTFRKEYEKELIEFYYSNLNEITKENDEDGFAKTPKIEEIFAGMNELRLVGLVTACSYFPIILIDPKIAANYGKDPDAYQSFLLGDKTDFVLAYMKANENYKNRLEEAVLEFAEYADSFDK